MSEREEEIFEAIFSNSKAKLVKCPVHGFFIQYPNGQQFSLQEYQPVLKKLLDNKIIFSNEGLKKILKIKVVEKK